MYTASAQCLIQQLTTDPNELHPDTFISPLKTEHLHMLSRWLIQSKSSLCWLTEALPPLKSMLMRSSLLLLYFKTAVEMTIRASGIRSNATKWLISPWSDFLQCRMSASHILSHCHLQKYSLDFLGKYWITEWLRLERISGDHLFQSPHASRVP